MSEITMCDDVAGLHGGHEAFEAFLILTRTPQCPLGPKN